LNIFFKKLKIFLYVAWGPWAYTWGPTPARWYRGSFYRHWQWNACSLWMCALKRGLYVILLSVCMSVTSVPPT